MKVQITLIVPVHNTEKYLRQCVTSIIAQTMFDGIEIILIDDGSTDNSSEICDEFAREYKNITVIHQENSGVSAARNVGLEKARGQYIAFVDSDDYIFSEMYERLFENAEKIKADMSVCGFVQCFPDKEVSVRYPFPEQEPMDKDFIQNNIYAFMLQKESFNSCCNKLFTRRVIDKSNIRFQVGRANGEDRRFVIDFLAKSDLVCYTPFIGYYYRLVPTSATQSSDTNCLGNVIKQYYEDLTLFGALGVDKKVIEKSTDLKLLAQALSCINFAVHKLTGKKRKKMIKSIVSNDEIRRSLTNNREYLKALDSRYEKLLYLMIWLKSLAGLKAARLAMRIKNSPMR
ncbi:MAG TPA: glycosyltransferase [Clostridia bacterium]|nr:glycosyltransferase [Clostridia bacterium]